MSSTASEILTRDDYRVADLSLADWGRSSASFAKHHMTRSFSQGGTPSAAVPGGSGERPRTAITTDLASSPRNGARPVTIS